MNHAIKARTGRASLAVGLVIVAISLGGCAAISDHRASEGTTEPPFAAGHESAREQLNDGYSGFYSSAKGLAKVDRIFYVKIESDDVQRVVDDVTDYSGQIAARLQRLTADYPALALDRPTDPPIVEAAHDAEKKATLKRFAPVVGDSGDVFERGLLIRLLGAVDQQHYLAATLAEREPNAALSKIMAGAAKRYAGFYDEIDTLLDQRFYR